MSITVKLSIPNISCHHCTMTIQRETGELAGVESVQGDVATKTATFVLKDEQSVETLKKTLAEIGYPAAN
jgi:copper chaperone